MSRVALEELRAPIADKLDTLVLSGRFPFTSSLPHIDFALETSKFLLKLGVKEQDVFPGLHGEVRVTGYIARGYLEITKESNDALEYVLMKQGAETGLSVGDDVTIDQLRHAVIKFVEENS
jgi:predicted transport protein